VEKEYILSELIGQFKQLSGDDQVIY